MADVSLDFGAAELYRFVFKMEGTGWVQSPMSWHGIHTKLQRSRAGRAMLRRIVGEFERLQPDEALFLLDRAYIVQDLNVQMYQGRRLAAGVKVDVTSYIALVPHSQ